MNLKLSLGCPLWDWAVLVLLRGVWGWVSVYLLLFGVGEKEHC